MKVLVTGSNGNIGAVLTRQLMKRHEVRAMVHYNSHNIPEGVELVKADVRFTDEVDDALRGCDAVIHLAAQIHVDHSRRYPELFYETNVKGTMNILEAARRHGASMIQMSTCEVLGHIPEGKADETYPYRWPMSPYAASKLAAEQYCLSWYQTYGLDIFIARGFNLVGPYQRPGEKGSVIPIFVDRVLRGDPPRIYGDGLQIRDYLDVRDLSRGLLALLNSGRSGEIFHFCSGIGVTVKELAEMIIKEADADLEPEYVEARPGELRRSVGSYDKARRLLGWNPAIPLRQTVRELLEARRALLI